MEPLQPNVPLGASAQAAYAEILEVTRHAELSRSIENLSGSFNRKTVKGSTYWYYQFTEGAGGKTRQQFVGPDSEELRQLVARARKKSKTSPPIGRLAKAAMMLGCAATTPTHFRVIRRLNEIGFFRAGGVLIGTHAFLAYGNALGVSWGDLSRTQDIDLAHAGNHIELALPASLTIETRGAIESLEAGFLPVPGFGPKDRSATFISKADRQLRVDFLTPMVGGRDKVQAHDDLGVNLQPLRFLEFVLEDVEQAAIISAVGVVIANVPDPARYALHKLLVHAERRERNPVKAQKDLRQAAALIDVLYGDRRDGVVSLWKDILKRGPGWRSRARIGLTALAGLAPQLEALGAMGTALGRGTAVKRAARPK